MDNYTCFDQILTKLEITIPFQHLLEMILTGVLALGKAVNANNAVNNDNNEGLPNIEEDIFIDPSQRDPNRMSATPEQVQDSVNNVTCFLMMIDLIVQQVLPYLIHQN